VSTEGTGVRGEASAAESITYGVYGVSNSLWGTGVLGSAPNSGGAAYGGWFETASTAGAGVYAVATAFTGYTCGVYASINSTSGIGVHGYAPCYGVYGQAVDFSDDSFGVYGYAMNSPSGRGVYGSGAYCGVEAQSTDGDGIRSFSSGYNKSGVYGVNNLTDGTVFGVYGRTYSPSGYGVYYSGGIGGTGLMRAIVQTSQGPTGLDVVTAAGSWVEDFGEGTLVNGRCHIELDPLFMETVTIDAASPMKVFLQACDESCLDLVVKRGQTAFDVISPTRTDAAGAFTYRVVAKRKGFEEKRLDVCEAARADSYLYPELREKELREYEVERVRRDEERARRDEADRRRESERARLRHEEEQAVIGHAAMNE
jgi:hypothetical protein